MLLWMCFSGAEVFLIRCMVGGGECYEMQVEDNHVGLSRVPCTKIYTQPSIVFDSCLTWYHFSVSA